MKVIAMKKLIVPSLIILSTITAQTALAKDQEQRDKREKLAREEQIKLERTITGIHTKLFAADNLYKDPLDGRQWNEVLVATRDFIEKRVDAVRELHNTNVKKIFSQFRSSTMLYNKELTKFYKKIKTASDELVKTIKTAYAELFESGEPKDQKLMEKFSKKFDAINKDMEALTTELKDEMSIFKDKIKNETSDDKKEMFKEQERVLTVLHRLSLTLALTAKKAQNDLKK
jgi:murein DD-endopeptidase MepM/ murein hydrolase activator NlpD